MIVYLIYYGWHVVYIVPVITSYEHFWPNKEGSQGQSFIEVMHGQRVSYRVDAVVSVAMSSDRICIQSSLFRPRRNCSSRVK